MIDTDRLITALKYPSTRHLYIGDMIADSAECIETLGDRKLIIEEIKDQLFGECLNQFPEEDFLVHIIDEITEIQTLKKAEMVDRLTSLCAVLEDIQQTQLYATEYAVSVVRELK